VSLETLVAAGPPRTRKGPGCSVGIALASLPDSESIALTAMLASNPTLDGGWKNVDISEAIKGSGIRIKGETIARHRRGGCSCESR